MNNSAENSGLSDAPQPPQRRSITAFLHSWNGVAATLIDRHLNIVASTALGQALFPDLRPGENLARQVFLGWDTGDQPVCAEDVTDQVVAALQALVAIDDEDEEFRKIVGELSTLSRKFSTAWAHGAEPLHPSGSLRADHPEVGAMSLTYQLLTLSSEHNDVLIIWQARDDASESALRRLLPGR